MKVTRALRMHSARLTLFTRKNCSLCDEAKAVLRKVEQRRPFELHEIDVMEAGQQQWRDVYEFDTPVLHVQRVFHTYSKPDIVTEAKKLMHRFTESEVEALLEQAEGHS